MPFSRGKRQSTGFLWMHQYRSNKMKDTAADEGKVKQERIRALSAFCQEDKLSRTLYVYLKKYFGYYPNKTQKHLHRVCTCAFFGNFYTKNCCLRVFDEMLSIRQILQMYRISTLIKVLANNGSYNIFILLNSQETLHF